MPARSTTATATWWPLSRHFFSAACAATSAVSGVSCFTVNVAPCANARAGENARNKAGSGFEH